MHTSQTSQTSQPSQPSQLSHLSKPPLTPTSHPSPAPTPRRSASSLLNLFLPGAKSTHKMESNLRARPSISYAESEASENRSPFNTPHSQRLVINVDESDVVEEDDDDEILFTTSRSRSGLRARRPNRSLKFLENGETSAKRPRPKKRSAIEEVCISSRSYPHSLIALLPKSALQ
jgi:hypothetical protein